MLLDIPDARTANDKWYDCGLVCARAILSYYDKDTSFANRLAPSERTGLSLSSLTSCFELAGLRVCQGSLGIETLKRIRSPVILCINAEPEDHYVVYRGFVRQRIYYFDPTIGHTSKPVDKFLSCWHSVSSRPLSQYGMIVS